jgi:MFS family permease
VALGFAGTVPAVVVAAVVTGLGNGLLLPAMLSWALGSLTFEQRGRATGVWTSALFVGQFVCPLVVLALTGALGSLGTALALLGAVSVVAAVGVRLTRPVAVAAAH